MVWPQQGWGDSGVVDDNSPTFDPPVLPDDPPTGGGGGGSQGGGEIGRAHV